MYGESGVSRIAEDNSRAVKVHDFFLKEASTAGGAQGRGRCKGMLWAVQCLNSRVLVVKEG
jgi:hypothetical protein